MHFYRPQSFRRPMRWLPILFVSLICASPKVIEAALAGGGCTTTMTLTYVNGVQKWVCRIDPLNVQQFQLDVQWDPARARLDTAAGIGFKVPFAQNVIPILDQAGGRLSDIGGVSATAPAGDADIFELVFIDLQPGLPINQAPFTVFASSNDSIVAFDTDTNGTVTFNFTQIIPTTRSVTPGVRPHIWDPDGAYNSGHTGGPGIWDTNLIAWDDLPLAAPPSDTPWNNANNATDIAVFGGDPGNGTVLVTAPISVGGFQFDISGYSIQSNALLNTINLAAAPGAASTINTGANNATIGSPLTGSGFTKVGTGTLTLTGANTYTGATTVNAGTLLANNTPGSGTGNSDVIVSPSLPPSAAVVGGSGAIAGPVGVQQGGTLLGGTGKKASGALTLSNDLVLQSGAFLALALGPAGAHSTLNRGGGVWTFATNKTFAFRHL